MPVRIENHHGASGAAGRSGSFGNDFFTRYTTIVNRIYAICRIPRGTRLRVDVPFQELVATFPEAMQNGEVILNYFKTYAHEAAEICPEIRERFERRFAHPEFRQIREALEDEKRRPQLLDAIEDLHILVLLETMKNAPTPLPVPPLYERVFAELGRTSTPMNILDIGPGISGMHFLVRKDIPAQHYFLFLDKSKVVFNFLVQIRRKLGTRVNSSIRLVNADFLNFSDPRRSYHIIFAASVMHYLPRDLRAPFLANARRLSISGGKLIIFDSSPPIFEDHTFLEEDIRTLAEQHHFRIIQHFPVPALFGFTYELEAV